MSIIYKTVHLIGKKLKYFKSVEFAPIKLKENVENEWVANTLTPDALYINLLGGPNDFLEKLENKYPIEMKHFYVRYCLNRTGEGPGGKFYSHQ